MQSRREVWIRTAQAGTGEVVFNVPTDAVLDPLGSRRQSNAVSGHVGLAQGPKVREQDVSREVFGMRGGDKSQSQTG